MKNKIKKLLFGSVTRELVFLVLFLISTLVAVDVIKDISLYGVSWFTSNLISSIIYGIESGFILYIVIILLISSENRINEFLFGTATREIVSTIFLSVLCFILFSTSITILFIVYLLVRRKAAYIVNICNGIKIIAEGNLDYKIELKGHDELAVLSKEINNMSLKLKNKIEEERAAERLKNELITNVSHDLRTPLTALIGYIQLAADDYMTFDGKDKYAKISLEKSKKLKMLIDDLFEYSKLESGGIKLEKVKVNIIEIIEQSIGELSIQAKEREIEFNKNYTSSKVELLVDPNQMARVFENIIENAVKYSVQGSNVNINLHEKDEDVIISFENIVDGILEEDLDKVFDRFYRADESRNSEVSGSGLGLAIAKSVVELHKGKIWAKIEEDKFVINIELNKETYERRNNKN